VTRVETAVPVALLPALGGFGLLIGSFLNVLIHRVPARQSLVRPRSSCPACGHAVRGYDNVPVLSWLVLRGRCRDCSTPIPWRYPAVEGSAGLVFLAIGLRLGLSWYLAAVLVVAAAGIALAVIDLAHQRLPFVVTGATAALTAALLTADAVTRGPGPIPVALASAGVWLAVYGGVWLVTTGRGMGLGDVALAPLLGLTLGWTGWGASVTGLLAGFVVGAVVGIGLLATGVVGRRSRVPHGPFMLAGAAIGLFVGPHLWSSYLALTGLG
jgi:leader peptidase (prepilin peptidase)/N-methyltransferase